MTITTVTNSKTIKEFHAVPAIIYKNDKNYIPHLKQDIEKVFDPKKNKAFAEGGECIRYILKDDDGKLIGRVAAFINPKSAKAEKQPTGGLGFFECIDDQNTANLLFNTCKKWLQERGMEAMDGPINFGERNQFWGCLYENFTDPNSYAMNYNPPYYPALFENYGFQTLFNQYVYKRDMFLPVQPVFLRKYDQLMENPDIHIRNVKGMDLEQVAEDFRTVYNGAWGNHEGFEPMKKKSAQKIMQALKPVLDPRIIIFVYYKKEPIAFYVNMPELNEIFKYVNGNLNWLGKLKFLYHKWKGTPKTMVGIVFGVVSEWQRKGVEGAMIKFAEDEIVKKNWYTETVLTWIGDFNPKMIKVCENLGAEKYRSLKTYRYLFDKKVKFERAAILE